MDTPSAKSDVRGLQASFISCQIFLLLLLLYQHPLSYIASFAKLPTWQQPKPQTLQVKHSYSGCAVMGRRPAHSMSPARDQYGRRGA
ncbi:hypothetical protein AK812_SmicGene21610 [Symbiodinium microadriaticum]|uniref:Uncharacterized protein n=1 Tax=Symbiodinium microadriaticum TaxID=2951 RepID=A0A1Q9DLV7_SYMMI|nr:hypothetical protein AK812_SmicGene21610 [Symbiodinium microadriaticum]